MNINSNKNENRKPLQNPRENANILSILTYWWTLPTFISGFRRNLTAETLFWPVKNDRSSLLGKKLAKEWDNEKYSCKDPSLQRALFRVFGIETLLYGVPYVLNQVCLKMSQPLLLAKLLNSVRNQNSPDNSETYFYVSIIIGTFLANSIISHWYSYCLQHLGMKIRIACSSLIYQKSLKLGKRAIQTSTATGQIINLLSNDVNRFDKSVIHFHSLWFVPIEVMIVIYGLCEIVDTASALGIIIIVLLFPLQGYLGAINAKLRLKIAIKTDRRVQLISEMISGIQIIKMYTWEKYFNKLIKLARKLEIDKIRNALYIKGILLSLFLFSTRLSIFTIVLVGSLTNKKIDANYVFVATAFYNVLKQTTSRYFVQGISQVGEARSSVARIEKFLTSEETEVENCCLAILKSNKNVVQSIAPNNTKIIIKDGRASWSDASKPILKGINVDLCGPQLVALTGSVGSGKSSLIKIILRELSLDEGDIEVIGRVSYCSQEPWLFAGTIRENITFTETLNSKKYQRVIDACSLNNDFNSLPMKDETLIGERGVTLSGGQKARISLARALYKDSDIYLLDDPLSAVDSNVGKTIYEEGIKKYLRDKCTIFVTHQLQYLQNVEKVLKVENGELVVSSASLPALELLNNETTVESTPRDNYKENDEFNVLKAKVVLQTNDKEAGEGSRPDLTGVNKGIYLSYIRDGGSICGLLCLLLLFVLTQISATLSDYFIAYWVNLESDYTVVSKEMCIVVYSVITAFMIFITFLRSFCFFKYCTVISNHLHNTMFSNVVQTSLLFFNTTSSGKILNRFSKDMGAVDELLPAIMMDCLQVGLNVIGVGVIIAIVKPWMILVTATILGIFYACRKLYLMTSCNLKRLEASTRSPIFAQASATVQGLTTIRAFGAQEILQKAFDEYQDTHTSAWFMYISCATAFGFWLDVICVSYIAIVAFVVSNNAETGGNVGLAITQAASLTGLFQWGIRQWSDLENHMTSVERIKEYSDIKPEKERSDTILPANWPDNGSIAFRSVSLKYFDSYVLHDLCFNISPKEKVGIVGRTGAGKSSLINAIFQLINIEGQIWIDGVDINTVPLHLLRSRISIIPQQSILFSGSIRENIDPFNELDDSTIWNALQEVNLKNTVAAFPLGLSHNILEGDSKLSAGQTQLICLARAITRNNKILILDEATANLDPKTDQLIQDIIKKKFKDCTVLTIAHRLNTVVNSDKILVLDYGRLVEFDSPQKLLEDENSFFFSIVKNSDVIKK